MWGSFPGIGRGEGACEEKVEKGVRARRESGEISGKGVRRGLAMEQDAQKQVVGEAPKEEYYEVAKTGEGKEIKEKKE